MLSNHSEVIIYEQGIVVKDEEIRVMTYIEVHWQVASVIIVHDERIVLSLEKWYEDKQLRLCS